MDKCIFFLLGRIIRSDALADILGDNSELERCEASSDTLNTHTMFAFWTVLILFHTDLTRCWKHPSEILGFILTWKYCAIAADFSAAYSWRESPVGSVSQRSSTEWMSWLWRWEVQRCSAYRCCLWVPGASPGPPKTRESEWLSVSVR